MFVNVFKINYYFTISANKLQYKKNTYDFLTTSNFRLNEMYDNVTKYLYRVKVN